VDHCPRRSPKQSSSVGSPTPISNFAHKGKVYLFDAYFDRTPRSHKLGFKAADVSKAEAIFISHAHFDHISDIGPVSRQTGAPVVGAPITAETAKKLGAPETQIVVAKGGEK
jgi:L-ascorbate metabolism protein UlaG (beta-lactamase superfamily)